MLEHVQEIPEHKCLCGGKCKKDHTCKCGGKCRSHAEKQETKE